MCQKPHFNFSDEVTILLTFKHLKIKPLSFVSFAVKIIVLLNKIQSKSNSGNHRFPKLMCYFSKTVLLSCDLCVKNDTLQFVR